MGPMSFQLSIRKDFIYQKLCDSCSSGAESNPGKISEGKKCAFIAATNRYRRERQRPVTQVNRTYGRVGGGPGSVTFDSGVFVQSQSLIACFGLFWRVFKRGINP